MSYILAYASAADGLLTVPSPISAPVWELALLPDVNDACVLHQDFACRADTYSPPGFGYTYPGYAILAADSGLFWVGDTNFKPDTGGMLKFTRTFAKKPATHTKAGGVYYFRYPGLSISTTAPLSNTLQARRTAIGNNYYRLPFTWPASSKIERVFYRIGEDYPDASLIPIVKGWFAYCFNITNILTGDDLILDNSGTTTPSAIAYFASGYSGGWMAAQDSTISPWMGNIFVRDTIYIPIL